jgi:hypothetical protein
MLRLDFGNLHIVEGGEIFVCGFITVDGGLGDLLFVPIHPVFVQILELDVHILLRDFYFQIWYIGEGILLGGESSFPPLHTAELPVILIPPDGVLGNPLSVSAFVHGALTIASLLH